MKAPPITHCDICGAKFKTAGPAVEPVWWQGWNLCQDCFDEQDRDSAGYEEPEGEEL